MFYGFSNSFRFCRTHISKTVDQVRENDKRCVVISDEDDDLLVSHLDSQEMELSNQQHQASQEYISKVSRQDNTCMVPRTDNMCMVPQKDKTCMVPQKDKTCMSQHYNSYRVSQQDNTYDKIGGKYDSLLSKCLFVVCWGLASL